MYPTYAWHNLLEIRFRFITGIDATPDNLFTYSYIKLSLIPIPNLYDIKHIQMQVVFIINLPLYALLKDYCARLLI